MSLQRLFIVFIIILFALLPIAFFSIHIAGEQLVSSLLDVNVFVVVFLLIITVSFLLGRFFRWQYLLRRIDVRIPIRPSISIYFASLAGVLTPLYIGEVVIRGILLSDRYSVPVRVTVWTYLTERLLDISALLILGLLAGISFGPDSLATYYLLFAFLAGIILRALASRAGIDAASIMSPGTIAVTIIASIVIWLPVVFLIRIAGAGFDVEVSSASGVYIFIASTLQGILSIMPAGIGPTENLAVQQLEGQGISFIQAISILTLARICTTGFAMVIGVSVLIREWFISRKNQQSDDLHFDDIASEYHDQFQEHVWDYLLERKVRLMDEYFSDPEIKKGVGLDIGCGLGQQCIRLQRLGYTVLGLDSSLQLLRLAHSSGVSVLNGSALQLPFPDNSLSFVYMVGVLHHIPSRDLQMAACSEVQRVLKPGGIFIVHESNPRNPLFRFYMGYIFPLLKTIDEGVERWVETEKWENIGNFSHIKTEYFTFLPDFIPKVLMKPLRKIENWLELGSISRYSVHYMAALRKIS